jgi:hypothetical protein
LAFLISTSKPASAAPCSAVNSGNPVLRCPAEAEHAEIRGVPVERTRLRCEEERPEEEELRNGRAHPLDGLSEDCCGVSR